MVDSLVVDRALITEAGEGNGRQSRKRGHGTRVKKANTNPPPPSSLYFLHLRRFDVFTSFRITSKESLLFLKKKIILKLDDYAEYCCWQRILKE